MKNTNDCAYFNVSAIVKDVNAKNKVLYVINESDYKKSRYIDLDKIFDRLNINELIDFIKHGTRIKNVNDDEIKSRIINYNKALTKSLKNGFKKRILKRATVFYPFIRISNDFICTFFTLIEFFEGEKVFIVTEAIPGYNYITKDFKSHLDYINTALFDVRTGMHIDSKIFKYYRDGEKLENYENEVTKNYILKNYIEQNFNTDFSKNKCKIGILTNRKIVLNNNIKKSSDKDTFYESGIYTISLGKNNYSEYMRNGLENIFETNLMIYAIDKFILLSLIDERNKFEDKRLEILAEYINKTHKKLNFLLDYDLASIIQEYKYEQKERIKSEFSRHLGSFWRGFTGD